MTEFLRSIPADSKDPVQLVCYHPIQDAKLRRGEHVEPMCLAVEYEYEHPIREVFAALGWQGGTIHQVVAEIAKLRALADSLGELLYFVGGRMAEGMVLSPTEEVMITKARAALEAVK